jgi:hypothetical protein
MAKISSVLCLIKVRWNAATRSDVSLACLGQPHDPRRGRGFKSLHRAENEGLDGGAEGIRTGGTV